ncbi:serine/threonine-protein kinase RsbW [Haloactinospora alba]|uniref:Serine/threonine-protein kinase RsbW n=1 Tax=Haloactinospora alba TaxID=405555 RepID=A0A543NAC3_9ACTN|nr:serine/threonine-protein kinase RsbW [Haloactinospora alba]
MEASFAIALPRAAYTVPVMREFLGEVLRVNGITEECTFTILLAASEACTNVIDHGAPAATYEVTAHLYDGSCLLSVTHAGPEFAPAHIPAPDLDAESGRGIALMRSLVDEVTFRDTSPGAITVLLRKHLCPGAPADGRPDLAPATH